jgi:hypothetical protein
MKSLVLFLVFVSTQAMASIVLNVRCESEAFPYSSLNMQLQMKQNPSVDYLYSGNLESQSTAISGVEHTRSTFKANLLANYSRALTSMVRLNLDLKKCNNVAIAGRADITNISYTLVSPVRPTLECKCVYAQ